MTRPANWLRVELDRAHEEATREARYKAALERIASAQPPEGDCTCGHVAWACHKRNANIYCGGVTSWAVWLAREALEPAREDSA